MYLTAHKRIRLSPRWALYATTYTSLACLYHGYLTPVPPQYDSASSKRAAQALHPRQCWSDFFRKPPSRCLPAIRHFPIAQPDLYLAPGSLVPSPGTTPSANTRLRQALRDPGFMIQAYPGLFQGPVTYIPPIIASPVFTSFLFMNHPIPSPLYL